MAKNLVIVESPTKAKTIEKYLGKDYKVLASVGHIRDLPRSNFAIEIENGGVHLTYEVPKTATKHVTAIKTAAKGAERVFLATDLDREGEAIAWHVAEVAGIDTTLANRVVFTEITKDAILAAFEHPRQIDHALVDAQQARRAVDRIVGYRLSPTLWRNVSSGISAGRVQSVALRLIVDREDEIRRFTAQEYWSIHGRFQAAKDAPDVVADLWSVGGKRIVSAKQLADREDKGTAEDALIIADEAAARSLRARALEVGAWTVADVTRRETRRNPAPPFTTSTLQQEAARKLGFSASRTMRIAQQLYEGVSLGEEQVGLITYMRTDSVNLSETALREVAELVRTDYGDRYGLPEPRVFKSKAKGAQEAHEAIRPSSAQRRPAQVARYLDKDQLALYELIWKRTIATQMVPAVFDNVRADLVGSDGGGSEFRFRATGQVLKFDGFISVYVESSDEEDGEGGAKGDRRLPDLTDGQAVTLGQVDAEQHFTEPPPRFSEASLVKILEAEGIGRPSTYASIIQTLVNREYVRLESRRFFPTPLGEVVTAYLKQHFSEIVDVGFTARMEEELDEIAEGTEQWGPMVQDFLHEVDGWIAERKPERPRIPIEGAECPDCGSGMQKVFSGKSRQWFASCERFPDCKGSLPLDEYGNVTSIEELQPEERVRCPECGKATLRKTGRYGVFYGCVDYPNCKGIVNVERRIGFGCPKCAQRAKAGETPGDGQLTERMSRYGKPFYGCNRYPDCDFAMWSTPLAQPCPNCGGPLKPPRKNAKLPVAVCGFCEEKVELDDSDPPRVVAYEYVPGLEDESAAEEPVTAE
jgi:DNA topoisomerase-1